MKVKAVYEFEFEPDTSWMAKDKKCDGALEAAKKELAAMLDFNEITVDDFEYDVIDDGDDHKIEDNIILKRKARLKIIIKTQVGKRIIFITVNTFSDVEDVFMKACDAYKGLLCEIYIDNELVFMGELHKSAIENLKVTYHQ